MTTLRHSAVIAKRSLIGTWRTPEALVDVTLQPIIFLLLLPIARAVPLVGAVLADMARYALLCVVMLGLGYIIGFRATTSVPEVLAACLLPGTASADTAQIRRDRRST